MSEPVNRNKLSSFNEFYFGTLNAEIQLPSTLASLQRKVGNHGGVIRGLLPCAWLFIDPASNAALLERFT